MADCILGHRFHDEMVSKIKRLEKENEKLKLENHNLTSENEQLKARLNL